MVDRQHRGGCAEGRRTARHRNGGPAIAPDLPVPDQVREAVAGATRSTVLDQGFTARELGLDWWHENLLPEFTARLRVDLGDASSSPAQLRRRDVMAIAREALSTDSDDEAILTLLWYVLAWGSRTTRRHNRRRIDAFRNMEQRKVRTQLLRKAAADAAAGDVAAAYGTLIRKGGGVVPGLGPAFFTKLLYFAGAGAVEHRAAILDARVARTLLQLGWASLPDGWFNWYTATYVSYCDLLACWARELEAERRGPVGIDEIEIVLFRWGGAIPRTAPTRPTAAGC